MNAIGQCILRGVEKNDNTLTKLIISSFNPTQFSSESYCDYSRLGKYIAENTQVKHLDIYSNGIKLRRGDEYFEKTKYDDFFNGLKSNSSVSKVTLHCNGNVIIGWHTNGTIFDAGFFHEVLKTYQENNEHITSLEIIMADLRNGGEHAITETLQRCANIKELDINNIVMGGVLWTANCRQLLEPVVEAVRGHLSIENLSLQYNQIRTAECELLATLLEDPNCNLRSLNLHGNIIDNEGASYIVNSLTNNTKLRRLFLGNCSFRQTVVEGAFSIVLCDTSSVNSTYSSNHTFYSLSFAEHAYTRYTLPQVACSLQMNRNKNKSHVAIMKILQYHPSIDMSPLFKLDTEEDEQSLKGLPYVVDWFERASETTVIDRLERASREAAKVCLSYDSWNELGNYEIDRRKLSSIYQFAQAMPLLLVPTVNVSEDDKKRKRNDI